MVKKKTVKTDRSRGKDPKTGRFVKGNKCSKNRPGRTKASQFKAAITEALSPEQVSLLFRRMYQLAVQKGDIAAGRIILEYLIGKPKPSEAENCSFKLPSIESAHDIPSAATAVLAAFSQGTLDEKQALVTTSMLSTLMKSYELHDLAARIENLEQERKAEYEL